MRIEGIKLKNFRAFKDVTLKDLPPFVVLVGANGTGKSTLFSVFAFLRDAMASNVTSALGRLGGSRGFQDRIGRRCTEYRMPSAAPLPRSASTCPTTRRSTERDAWGYYSILIGTDRRASARSAQGCGTWPNRSSHRDAWTA